jgi:hypothetical protein
VPNEKFLKEYNLEGFIQEVDEKNKEEKLEENLEIPN